MRIVGFLACVAATSCAPPAPSVAHPAPASDSGSSPAASTAPSSAIEPAPRDEKAVHEEMQTSDTRPAWTPTFVGMSAPFHFDAPVRLGADASKATGERDMVRLERTGCFGSCPVYTVELHADGKVVYSDIDGNDAKRTVTGKLPAAEVAALEKRLVDAGFFRFTWDDPCKRKFTDMPGANVTLVSHGRTRTIKDYHGNTCIPNLVHELENEIDHVANGTVWPD